MRRFVPVSVLICCILNLWGQSDWHLEATRNVISGQVRSYDPPGNIYLHPTNQTATLELLLHKPKSNLYFSLSNVMSGPDLDISNPLESYRIEITGKLNGIIVYPTIIPTDFVSDTRIEGNTIITTKTFEEMPIYFVEPVDVIRIDAKCVSDSCTGFGLRFNQFTHLSKPKIISNPPLNGCSLQSIMIGMDKSASITPKESTEICEAVYQLVADLELKQELQLTLVEFGSSGKIFFDRSIHVDSRQHVLDDLFETLYREFRFEETTGRKPQPTNWETVFELAGEHDPDVLVMITDGWPNNVRGKGRKVGNKFGVDHLVPVANALKSSGTRLLFIGKNMSEGGNSLFLDQLTSGDHSVWAKNSLESSSDVDALDYIIVDGFNQLPIERIQSLLSCNSSNAANEPAEVAVFPNPNDGSFHVDLKQYGLNDLDYDIYDAKGSVIPGSQLSFSDAGIDVRMLDPVPGQYVILVTVEGRKMVGRFMVSGR